MQQGGYRVNRLTGRLYNIPAPICNRLASRLRTSYIVYEKHVGTLELVTVTCLSMQ